MAYPVILPMEGRVLYPLWEKLGLLYVNEPKYRPGKKNLMFKTVSRGIEIVKPVYNYLLTHGYTFSGGQYYNNLTRRQEFAGFVTCPDGRRIPMRMVTPEYRDWITEITGFTKHQFIHRVLASGLASKARWRNSSRV